VAESTPIQRFVYLSRRFVYLAYALSFALAWWVLPGGFPPTHLKFWCNQVALPGLALIMAVGFYADLRDRRALSGPLALGVGCLTAGIGLAAGLVFLPRLLVWGILAVIAGGLLVLGAKTSRGIGRSVGVGVAVGFGGVGVLLVIAQRGLDPSTRPTLATMGPSLGGRTQEPTTWRLESPKVGTVTVDAASEAVHIGKGRYQVRVEPLLTFTSRSLDHGWTFFASPRERRSPARHLLASDPTPRSFAAEYGSREPAWLFVSADSSLRLEGRVELKEAVYSHINSYSTVLFSGHTKLELEFAPCPGIDVEPMPHDYPIGRPLRFATLDMDGRFRVVEATSAEKGPFTPLAEGSLERGEPLTITLRDEGKPVLAITFEDWSTQLSTALSPTAGWGIPENAVIFLRQSEAPTSVVSLDLTLASTAVGRGFDSVGHAAGGYQNRMTVTWF
jgi:hypothetical protein